MFDKYFATTMMTLSFLSFVIINGILLKPMSEDASGILIGLCLIWPMWILVMWLKESEIDSLRKWREEVYKILRGDK